MSFGPGGGGEEDVPSFCTVLVAVLLFLEETLLPPQNMLLKIYKNPKQDITINILSYVCVEQHSASISTLAWAQKIRVT